MMNLDQYSRQVLTETDAVNMLYRTPNVDIKHLQLDDVEKFNNACRELHIDLQLTTSTSLHCTPEQYHKQNQQKWNMPTEYADFDIAKWCLDQCTTDGLFYVVWRHPLADIAARAIAPVGAVFALLTLVTGALWGKPMWGEPL